MTEDKADDCMFADDSSAEKLKLDEAKFDLALLQNENARGVAQALAKVMVAEIGARAEEHDLKWQALSWASFRAITVAIVEAGWTAETVIKQVERHLTEQPYQFVPPKTEAERIAEEKSYQALKAA